MTSHRTSVTRTAGASVVEEAFLQDNPDIKPDMLTVTCKADRIQEVRMRLSGLFIFTLGALTGPGRIRVTSGVAPDEVVVARGMSRSMCRSAGSRAPG